MITSSVNATLLAALLAISSTAIGKEIKLGLLEVRSATSSAKFQQSLHENLKKSCPPSITSFSIAAAYPPFSKPREEVATQLLKNNPDVVIATTRIGAKVLRDHPLRHQPIVFHAADDPTKNGLINSYSEPGNNLTGLTSYLPSEPKRLALMRELFPNIRKIGLVYDTTEVPAADILAHIEVAKSLGFTAKLLNVGNAEELVALPKVAAAHSLEALDVSHTRFPSRVPRKLIDTINSTGLPAIYDGTHYVEYGGLLSYEPKDFDIPAVTAELICTVLRTGDAGKIPVRRPTEFVTAVNLATAQQIGIPIPKWLLKRADVVIGMPAQAATGR